MIRIVLVLISAIMTLVVRSGKISAFELVYPIEREDLVALYQLCDHDLSSVGHITLKSIF